VLRRLQNKTLNGPVSADDWRLMLRLRQKTADLDALFDPAPSPDWIKQRQHERLMPGSGLVSFTGNVAARRKRRDSPKDAFPYFGDIDRLVIEDECHQSLGKRSDSFS
jgi:hypothetical protein